METKDNNTELVRIIHGYTYLVTTKDKADEAQKAVDKADRINCIIYECLMKLFKYGVIWHQDDLKECFLAIKDKLINLNYPIEDSEDFNYPDLESFKNV